MTYILGHFNPQHLREWEEHLILLNSLQAHYRGVHDVNISSKTFIWMEDLSWMEAGFQVVNWRWISPGMGTCLTPASSAFYTIYSFLRSFHGKPKPELPQRKGWSRLLQKSVSSQPCTLETIFRRKSEQGKRVRYFYESNGLIGGNRRIYKHYSKSRKPAYMSQKLHDLEWRLRNDFKEFTFGSARRCWGT